MVTPDPPDASRGSSGRSLTTHWPGEVAVRLTAGPSTVAGAARRALRTRTDTLTSSPRAIGTDTTYVPSGRQLRRTGGCQDAPPGQAT